MTDPMTDNFGQRQARTGSVAEPSAPNDCQSDDAERQVAETERLQGEAQQRINKGAVEGIGARP
jgi:hypothetical protein